MGFGRGRTSGEGGAPASGSSRSDGEVGGLTAFIDQGSSFEGKLSFKDTVRIDGHFAGEISSENTLVIGETGEIEADIRSKTVIVSGSIHGDVTAARKVVLHKTARVDGNVETPSLVIEEGAVLVSQVRMPLPESPRKSSANLKAVGSTPPASPKA